MKHGRLAQESGEYKRIREELLEAEIALRDQRERVAELRRRLPLDVLASDYIFQEGPQTLDRDDPVSEVRLSELFQEDDSPLILYQFMYGGAQQRPCPMCSMWVDGFNGVGRHLHQTVNFAVVAEARIGDLRRWARQRGWHGLRLLSSRGSTFKADLNFQDPAGNQFPGLSVFVRLRDGSVRHFYSVSAIFGENEYRGLDLYSPVWNLLDLTPRGRGDWMPRLEY